MRNRTQLKSILIAVGLVCAAITPHAARAQGAGTIRGVVTDPSAAVVPNATVAATGNGVTRTAKSDGQGRYSVANVPAGSYTVTANAQGFVTQQKTVSVSSGQVSPLDMALQIQTETQQVQVTDQANTSLSTDASANVGALVLKDTDLDALPDDPDDLQSDLEALAGPAAGPNGAQFFVDGFSGGQLPPKSSIREIRINSNPFSSEYDSPGFGRIEILTRPGTDKYHGQAFVNYGNRDFDTRNPFLTSTPPPYSSTLITGNLGGPITRKSSFFIDFNRRQIDEDAVVTAKILNSALQEVPYSAAVPTPNHFWSLSPRLDYAINKTNTLVVRYNHTASSQVGGVTGFTLPDQETHSFIKNNTVQITETSILGTKAVDETSFQFRDSHTNSAGVGSFAIPGINVTSSENTGGAPFLKNFTDNLGYELRNFITLAEGKHAIKVGFRAREAQLNTYSTNNFNGSYTFSAPDLSRGLPLCFAGAGITDPTSLDLYQQTEILLNQGVPISSILAEGCGPSQFTLSSGIPLQKLTQFDFSTYVQDDFRLRPNLTVNAGFRYETQTTIQDHLDLAPRFGFAWAPGAKANTPSKTVIRGGYGIFFSRFNVNSVLNTLRYNGVTQTNYVISAGDPNAISALSAYPNLPSDALLEVQNQAIYQVSSDYKAPYMMQSALGVERQLPGRTQVSVTYIDTRGLHIQRLRDINAPLPGTYIGPLPGSTTPVNPGIRPYAGGDIYQYESSGLFKQGQLVFSANSRVNSHFSLQGNYVYGHAHTNANTNPNGSANGFPMNQYNDDADWGRAAYDVRHRVVLTGQVGLPLKITLSPFMTYASGLPFNILTGQQFNGDGIFNARPAFVTPGITPGRAVVTPWGAFDALPQPGETIIPFDYGDGPAQLSVNFRISRSWGWGTREAGEQPRRGGGGGGGGGGFGRGGPGGGGGGRGGFQGFGGGGRGGFGGFGGGGATNKYNVTLTFSARNAFNHENLAAPNGVLTSPFFGQSTAVYLGQGGGFGGNNAAAGNRKVEMQLRFTF